MKKYFLFFVFILYGYTAAAQEVYVPDTIDFGICPTGLEGRAAVYQKKFQVINQSDSIIRLTDLLINYNYSFIIRLKGNYLLLLDPISKYFSPEREILPNDTIDLSIWYYSSFEDDVSKNEPLIADLEITYKVGKSNEEKKIKSTVKMRSLDKKEIFTQGNDIALWHYCSNNSEWFKWKMFLTMFNKSSDDYIIDSVKYHTDSNIEFIGINNVDSQDTIHFVELPYTIKSGELIYFITKIGYPEKKFNKITFEIYTTNTNDGTSKLFKDSLMMTMNESKPLFVSLNFAPTAFYLNDTFSKDYGIWANSCVGDEYYCDSIKVIGNLGKNKFEITPANNTYPVFIGNDSIVKLASYKIIALESGEFSGNIIAYFRDKDNNLYERYLYYSFFVYPYTDVDDNIRIVTDNIAIYPNPATDVINLSYPNAVIDKSKTIEIFNLLGTKLMSFHSSSNNDNLDVSKLPPGTYFVIVSSSDKVFRNRFIIK